MKAQEPDLNHYFTTHPCAVCHYQVVPETLLVLARREHTWVVMATCGHCRHRGIFVVSTPKPRQLAPTLSPARRGPISTADVRAMRSFLATFDGNFRGLFDPGSGGGQLAAE